MSRTPGLFLTNGALYRVPPPCRSPPLVVPRGGGGVTWSAQNFSFRLIVLLCGWLCCGALPLASLALNSTTMFPPGTSVMFIRSTGEPVLAQVVGHLEHGDAYRRITYDRDGKTVLHNRASVQHLSLPRAASPPRPTQSEASSSTRAEQRALVHSRPKRSLQSTLHAFLKPRDPPQ